MGFNGCKLCHLSLILIGWCAWSPKVGASVSCASRDTPSDDPRLQLCYLLLKNRKTFDISWSPPNLPPALFQNHIPYEIITLYKLGEPADVLTAGYNGQVNRHVLQPVIPSTGAVNESNWEALVGADCFNPSIHYSDYVQFYRTELVESNANETLSKFMPAVADGLFGHLWHGLQTLGYGFGDTGDTDMVAQGLAWMSTAFQPPAPLAKIGSRSDLTATLSDIHKDTRLPIFKGDAAANYFAFLADLAANYSTVMQGYDLQVSDDISLHQATITIEKIHDALIGLFAAGNASSMVQEHMISSAHSVAKLLPYCAKASTRAVLLRRHWQSVLYNYVIQNRPDPDMRPTLSPSPGEWSEIVASALKQADVHVHEIVYYLKDLSSATHSDEYRRGIASAVIQRFESGLAWRF